MKKIDWTQFTNKKQTFDEYLHESWQKIFAKYNIGKETVKDINYHKLTLKGMSTMTATIKNVNIKELFKKWNSSAVGAMYMISTWL